MTRRTAVALVVALTGCGVAVVAAAAVASGSARGEAPSRAALAGVNFVNRCGFSHRAPDDPIVSPGRAGASHDHTFVGNRTTSAFSTLGSLLIGSSSCDRTGHTAAYWMPTLLADGRPVEPLGSTIYYRRATLAAVQPFPTGFRMIAGSALAPGPQSVQVTSWNCGVRGGVSRTSSVPTCPDRRATTLRLRVTFPSCWNGRDLDTANHQAHVAYAMRGRCPSTHPVAVPAITLIYRYPALSGASVALASGPEYSAHADFFNAWNQRTLSGLVEGCLNALRHCGHGSPS